MKNALLLAVAILVTFNFYGQSSTTEQSLRTERADQQILNMIDEVYGTGYPDAELRKELVRLVKERISYVAEQPVAGKEYALLSTLPLMNAANPAIPAFVPGSFDARTFNPLHYGFNFFDHNYQYFRIDGTSYILVVKPYTARP